MFGPEVAPGVLALGLGQTDETDKRHLYLADLDQKSVRRMSSLDLIPRAWWNRSPPATPPGSPATLLAYDAHGRLVLFDPATGRTKPLTRGVSPRSGAK